MATRLKTVKYSLVTQAGTVTNNTLTTFTPTTTIYLPENSKVFRSVVATITMDDIVTATGGSLTTKTFGLRLGGAGGTYTTVSNANALTHSGENISFMFNVDFTAQFTSFWTGTSMVADFQMQVNQSTGSTLGMVNVSVTLDITYEYDDTSTTHVKSVMIPLDMPVASLATTATTYDTIPALDTYLPEASKVYRNIHIVVQGNHSVNGSTANGTMTLRVGAASVTTNTHVATLSSDRFLRYVWDVTAVWPSKAATQTWQPTSSQATRYNHMQAWLVVTYEFDPATSTSIMNSVMLPLDVASPMGGTTSSDYQRGQRNYWISEPGTITTNRIAFYAFWSQLASMTGLNLRIGTGAFVAYTDIAAAVSGSNAAMVRNDTAFTLARGKNSLNVDLYSSDTLDFGWNISGFFIVNYTSGKATDGVGAHNHTVEWGLSQNGTAAAASRLFVAATAPVIPETNHFFNSVGVRLTTASSGATGANVGPSGWTILVERLVAEGGIEWDQVYSDSSQSDPEVGTFILYGQARQIFNRWPTDPDPERLDIEVARRWQINFNGVQVFTGWFGLSLMLTYHTITYTISGTVTDYVDADGAGLTINLFRDDSGFIDHIGTVTTTTGGAYTFTWYNNTQNVFTTCHENTTRTGTSALGIAT